jgi:dTDP-glucose 4,6-dehydratase
MTMAYHRHHGLETRIVRIFNTYGPRMRLNDGRVVPNFIYQALTSQPLTVYGDGSQTRSFQYFSDLVDGVYRLLMSDVSTPVNIGNPAEITISEFAEIILEITGSQSEIVQVDPPHERVADDPKIRRPNITKAHEVLGWEPKVRLVDGLVNTIDYFRDKVT